MKKITSKNSIDGLEIQQLLKKAGMGTHSPELHKEAFENSYKIVLLYDEDSNRLIGCGRIISDGCYQGAVYDIAVDPDFQGLKLGNTIMNELVTGMEEINLILYASPGKEDFYRKFNFRLGKTSMIKFQNADLMQSRNYTD
ncbi:MAG: GNAT family N-acetyltransferase [Sebaldella sp.]|nr:GNAT family N-acetyltransferase [Sebaldella sp.]